MRKFALELREDGWQVAYTELDDTNTIGTIPGELIPRAAQHNLSNMLITEPGEWRLINALQDMPQSVRMLEVDLF
ncbi:MAG: cryptochrome/photolyase family protein [Aliishimia sp.]